MKKTREARLGGRGGRPARRETRKAHQQRHLGHLALVDKELDLQVFLDEVGRHRGQVRVDETVISDLLAMDL